MRLQLRRCKILKQVHVSLLHLFSRIIQLPEAIFEDSTYHPVMILHVVWSSNNQLDHWKKLVQKPRFIEIHVVTGSPSRSPDEK